MKKSIQKKTLALTLGFLFSAAAAEAAVVQYTTTQNFNINDVQCDKGIIGAACLNMASPILGADGLTYYAIDSSYGWNVKDFDPSALLPRPMDGIYAEGQIANILDATGAVIGVSAQNPETADWKTGPIQGEWMKGLGALKAKTATEHYVVMEHIMQSPYLPPLVDGVDYHSRLKDDGKILYYWGDYNQEPTNLYLYKKLPLPASWKVAGANFKVTSAKLVVDHNITNSPNDQIRPEDFENEYATGILPQYTICPTAPALNPTACNGLAAGTYVSAVDSYEGGDGEFLPAGTVLKAINPITGLLEATNAWYVTLDRDPFGGTNPRYRLKSSKYGQDLPGVELVQYAVGTPTTTTIDLLTIKDAVTGLPVLADSKNWNNYLDISDGVMDGYTLAECPMTSDLDLMFYIKGEVGKPTTVRSAKLMLEYEDPTQPTAYPVDLAITSTSIPTSAKKGYTYPLSVSVANLQPGVANGTLTLIGKNTYGTVVGNFSSVVTSTSNSTATTYNYTWKAPTYSTTVTWEAKVTAEKTDIVPTNNIRTSTTRVD